jgi:PAS domain S-box-containing protein
MIDLGVRHALGQATTILVVEDEQIVALGLQGKLEALGYRVPHLVASGEEAVALAEVLQPDLVLMDINLDGELDGVQAAQLIRDRLGTPVVYLTAYSNREVVERAKLTQPFGYILKPYVDRELQVVIEMALYRHQMERKLLQQQRLLAATLRSIGDGVIATDSRGRVTFLNPVAEELTGWSQAEAYGSPVEQVFHIVNELTGEPVASPVLEAMRQKVTVPLANHTALLTRGRAEVPIDDSAAPILDGEAVLGAVLVFRDMTARRLATLATAKLAAIVSSSDDAILSKTVGGVITSWNPGAERLFGYSAAEAVGRHVALLAPPERLHEVEAALAKVARGEPVPAYETVRRRKDGQAVEVIVTASPLRDESGAVIGAATITRDISHLRQLEQQFRQAQKMEAIGRLAGGVAHDFNNLLTVINGYTGIVLTSLHPHDKNREFLQQVALAGERAAALTQQLLAYSRKQLLQLKVVDLNELVAGTERLLRRLIGEDVELQIRPGEGLPRVKVDPHQIEQVVMNLAVNARDAMPKGGTLTIETAAAHLEGGAGAAEEPRPGPYALLRVSDTGCGMDEVTLAHLFEPFFTTKGVGKGTGLGLATVYGIVKQCGGHVEVSSRPGQGARFVVYLPGLEGEAEAEAHAGLAGLPGGTETVLLVEDEEGVRQLTANILKLCGYTVLEATNGEAALGLLAGHAGAVDLLLTDVVMPRMSGPQVAEAVRALHLGVKVLYQSGYTDDAVLRHGIAEGEGDFVQKPFTPGELARKVRDVLDRRGP